MKKEKIYHLNDRTLKYLSLAQASRQHQYLGLPGEFKTRLPQEIVFPNMDFGRADDFYVNDEGLVIDLEEESEDVTERTLEKFTKYVLFACYRYGKTYLAVLCRKNPKNYPECYEYAPSLFIKPHYIHIDQNELLEKYDNINMKVKSKIELTDTEALDIAFVCKFISKEYAQNIIENLVKAFKDAIIKDEILKMDVGVILGGMIIKNIQNTTKQNKLLKRINMRHIEKEIHKIVYDEYGNVLDAKDEEIEAQAKTIQSKNNEIKSKDKELKNKTNEINKLNQSHKKYQEKIKQLNELTDLNTPEAKKILNSLLLL